MKELNILKIGNEEYKIVGGASVSYDEENETIIVDNSGSGSTNPLRPLFLAEGALYNDTDAIIKRTPQWETEEKWELKDGTYIYSEEAALVDHLPGHYYLNGLGNITESEMINIYKYKDAVTRFKYPRCCQATSIRTFFGMWHQHGISTLEPVAYNTFYMNYKLESAMWYSGAFEKGYDNIVAASLVITPSELAYTFNQCTNLKYIHPMNLRNTTKAMTTTFVKCTSLKEIRLHNLKVNLDLSSSSEISKRSILHAIKNASPTTAITITLHPDAYARIANQPDILEALREKNGYTDESGNEIAGTLPAGASINLGLVQL